MAQKSIFKSAVCSFLFLLIPFFSEANIVVVNGLTHLHDVVPGETYRGVIEIQNTKSSDQAVKVYQRDYFFRHTGESLYEAPGSLPRSNADWVDLSPTYLNLKPREKTKVSYEITVPATDSLRGTYWSVIMVEGVKPPDEDLLHRGVNIQTQVRYAIQIATTVGHTGKRELLFLDANIEEENGVRKLAIDIENPGDFMFKPDVSAELFDEQGSSIGTFFADPRKIYPLTSTRFWAEIGNLPVGKYKALLLADCGDEDVFGINLELEIPNDQ